MMCKATINGMHKSFNQMKNNREGKACKNCKTILAIKIKWIEQK